MSALNNKPQMFTAFFPSNFWYPEVVSKWEPLVRRMMLPYDTLEDFMNQQIQQVTFPDINIPIATQERQQYEIGYQYGGELETGISKNLTFTFKLTESYLSYWIIWDQVDRYLHQYNDGMGRVNRPPIYMEPVTVGFLADNGIQLMEFTFSQIVPVSIGSLNLSYSATVASYNTFTWNLRYNYFDIS